MTPVMAGMTTIVIGVGVVLLSLLVLWLPHRRPFQAARARKAHHTTTER